MADEEDRERFFNPYYKKKVFEPRVCKLCEIIYIPTREWQEYCTPNCRKQAWRLSRRKISQ
ncbi:MAG: hypothetical protein CSYNP_03543 [Syntrophus sp. SKADARSKE-3]|nr:hypothetical protein [Syntrophus sp. SKADARSKE-3]